MGAVRGVLAEAKIRRLHAAWFGGVSAEYGALVAVSVYAFAEGGARAVALFGVLRMLPALVLTPIVTSVADRIPRERLLLWTVSVRAAALALVSAAILADRPLLVGIALAVSGPAAATGVATALMLGSVAALARLRVAGQQGSTGSAGNPVRQLVDDLVGGVRIYPATPGTSTLLGLAFVQTLVRGALTVLVVILAVDLLEIGEAGVGWLNAAMGLGGLAGGFLAVRVVRGRWLARWGALGVGAWGLP